MENLYHLSYIRGNGVKKSSEEKIMLLHLKWKDGITDMGNLKNRYKCTYLQNRSRVTDVENKLVVIRG